MCKEEIEDIMEKKSPFIIAHKIGRYNKYHRYFPKMDNYKRRFNLVEMLVVTNISMRLNSKQFQ